MKTLTTTILALAASLLAIGCFQVPPPPGSGDDDASIDSNVGDDVPDAGNGSCGNSHVDPGEDCDSGGVDTASCDSDCTAVACGDSHRNSAAEQCDDGNTTDDGNGCDDQCRKNATCSNGVVEDLFEACDDGNQTGNDGCSADCKEAVVSLVPVSDQAAVDTNVNGTFEYLNGENSTGEAIYYGVTPPPGEEHRLLFELDTAVLHPTYFVEQAHFNITDCCLSGQTTVELDGYMANNQVELADATSTGNVVGSFVAADNSPQSFDVRTFMQSASDQAWASTGFMLRVQTPLTDGFFNLGVETSNNSDPTQRPKLSMIFCVDANHDATCD
jgi:cysteine-rich repeat protein